jgi:ABC-2 type transport system ATP-binding protein
MIDIQGLAKTYIRRHLWAKQVIPALRGVNFRVEKSTIYGLLGLNGQGKSTTMKIIVGLCRPDAGSVSLFGRRQDYYSCDILALRRVSYLPELPYFPRHLSADELLFYYGEVFSMSSAENAQRRDQVLEIVGMRQWSRMKLGEMSKGMMQRVGIAQALYNQPDLLLLDEPMSGLDPLGLKMVRDIMLELRDAGKTILFSSHILGEVEKVCDRVGIMHGGCLVKEIEEVKKLRASKLEEAFIKAVS